MVGPITITLLSVTHTIQHFFAWESCQLFCSGRQLLDSNCHAKRTMFLFSFFKKDFYTTPFQAASEWYIRKRNTLKMRNRKQTVIPFRATSLQLFCPFPSLSSDWSLKKRGMKFSLLQNLTYLCFLDKYLIGINYLCLIFFCSFASSLSLFSLYCFH